MQNIIAAVLNAIPKAGLVEVEVSARHVHLTQDDVEALFGPGMTLTPKRPLSQPGQFLCEERVTLVGPRGRRERVAVLGPIRAKTQIELSASDCVELGVKAPVRLSGDVDGSGPIRLEGPKGSLDLTQGVIIAHNHIHLTPETAEIMRLGLSDYFGLHAKKCVELTPGQVFVPFRQHIGKPAVAVRSVGDTVEKGDLLAEAAAGGISANIHASIGGVVTEITENGARIIAGKG